MHKKITAIVPAYNVSKYLERCLESLCAQTLPMEDYEIVLIDDGSTDNSGDICDKYAYEYDNITVIHQKNAGPAAARNAGIEAADSEYVCFVDPDDYVSNKYLEVPCHQAVATEADIVMFDAYKEKYDESGNVIEKHMISHCEYRFETSVKSEIRAMQRQIMYPYMAAKVYYFKLCGKTPLAAPWDKIYSLEFLNKNNLRFHEELKVLDDMCFNFDSFGAAAKVSYVPSFLYHYQVVESSITNSYKEDRIINDMKVFDYLHGQIGQIYNDLSPAEHKDYEQALYARIIKSFAISLRLYFFNPKNPKMREEIEREIIETLNKEPYSEAYSKIELRRLETKLKIFTIACRKKNIWMLKRLYNLEMRHR